VGNYRNRELLDRAHEFTECQVQIPDLCEGHVPDGCEPAHSNQGHHGKAGRLKAHDCFFAASCHSCHAELDNGNKLTHDEKDWYWRRGFERTLLEMWKREMVGVYRRWGGLKLW